MSAKVWDEINTLLRQYGMGLEVVYETKRVNIPIALPYSELVFRNRTPLISGFRKLRTVCS